MNYFKHIALLISAISIFASCNEKSMIFTDPLISHRDTTVNPADDFFQYANGTWFNENPISSSDNSNGIFKTIEDTINSQIKQICEKSAAESKSIKGSNKQKIGDFYASGMDTLSIEKAGLNSLKKEFNKSFPFLFRRSKES